MSKILLIASLLIAVFSSVGESFAQKNRLDRDVDRRRFYQKEHDNHVNAKRNIRRGWTKNQVIAVLGQPERRLNTTDKGAPVEIWGYEGFDVRIEFRNGVVSQSYFRFIEKN